jgi:hypothetical protein
LNPVDFNPKLVKKILLFLICSPTLLATLMLSSTAARASRNPLLPLVPQNTPNSHCLPEHGRITCVRVRNGLTPTQIQQRVNAVDIDDPSLLMFSDEEGDVSIALFGCDCPACIRTIRQLRSISG